PLTGRQAAKVLMAAECTIDAGEFLPGPEKAEADNDREALNLLARHYLALHAREKKTLHLEQAWKVTQAALAAGKAERDQKDEARSLARLAEAWLREAEFSYHYDFSTSLGPRMHFDPFGNIFYSNYDPFSPEMMARQRGLPMAVKVGEVVKERPGDGWMAFVD